MVTVVSYKGCVLNTLTDTGKKHHICVLNLLVQLNSEEILSVSYYLTHYYSPCFVPLHIYSVGRCTDSGGTMTLSVMVKEPGYQDGRTDIGGWTCYLVAGFTPLTKNINMDWLGIISRH